jgi:hypothetical protein
MQATHKFEKPFNLQNMANFREHFEREFGLPI